MRPLRVCIYGGTSVKGMPEAFISELAYKILDAMPAVIVTGGFLHSNKEPKAISTDFAALEGARRYADKRGRNLEKYYEAWIPEPELDRRPDVGGVVRMTEHDGITVRVMHGRTPLGRRLAMVAGVDLVVTISGRQHTEVVVEQALELGLPVIPIPDAGGDSAELLKTYRERIAASFAPGAFDECLGKVSTSILHRPEIAADAVIILARTAKIGKCLVLFPYDDEHNRLYESSIKSAIAKHMAPINLSDIPQSAAIYTSFAEAMRASTAIVADITSVNKNVMYEIGYAHGLGLTPLLYTRDAAVLDQLPVYFKTLNIRVESEEIPAVALIDEYLLSVKDARRAHQLMA
jgi:nucleoside 2-deoxyribosyltransferase